MKFRYPPNVVAYIERGSKSFEDAVEEYERRLLRSFDDVRQHLDFFDLTSILDIGCGLGGMDILIAQEFGVKNIHLLDGEGEGKKLNRYSETETVPWYDVRIGKSLVEANVSANVYAHTKVTDINVNAIFSFRSWGHHFPVDCYLGLVRDCLVPGGIVLTDIRKGTDGIAKLETEGLARIASIPAHSVKCDRIIFRK